MEFQNSPYMHTSFDGGGGHYVVRSDTLYKLFGCLTYIVHAFGYICALP